MVEVWHFLGNLITQIFMVAIPLIRQVFRKLPGSEKSNDTGKAESPNRTKVFVSMAMAAV